MQVSSERDATVMFLLACVAEGKATTGQVGGAKQAAWFRRTHVAAVAQQCQLGGQEVSWEGSIFQSCSCSMVSGLSDHL